MSRKLPCNDHWFRMLTNKCCKLYPDALQNGYVLSQDRILFAIRTLIENKNFKEAKIIVKAPCLSDGVPAPRPLEQQKEAVNSARDLLSRLDRSEIKDQEMKKSLPVLIILSLRREIYPSSLMPLTAQNNNLKIQ